MQHSKKSCATSRKIYNELPTIAVAGIAMKLRSFKGPNRPLFLFLVVTHLAAKVSGVHLEVVEDGLTTLLRL